MELVFRSFITTLPVIFLLCITGLALKIGLASVVLFIAIKVYIDLILWMMFDFNRRDN